MVRASFCVECGYRVQEEFRFCPMCSTEIPEIDPPTTAPDERTFTAEDAPPSPASQVLSSMPQGAVPDLVPGPELSEVTDVVPESEDRIDVPLTAAEPVLTPSAPARDVEHDVAADMPESVPRDTAQSEITAEVTDRAPTSQVLSSTPQETLPDLVPGPELSEVTDVVPEPEERFDDSGQDQEPTGVASGASAATSNNAHAVENESFSTADDDVQKGLPAPLCRTCLEPLDEGVAFCTICGTPVSGSDSADAQPASTGQLGDPSASAREAGILSQSDTEPDPTAGTTISPIEDTHVLSAEAAEVTADRTCETCGAPLGAALLVCTNCGTPVSDSEADQEPDSVGVCGTCGAPLEEGQRACSICDTPVGPVEEVRVEETSVDAPLPDTPEVDVDVPRVVVSDTEKTAGLPAARTEPTDRTCGACGTLISTVLRFCTNCGAPIPRPQSSHPEPAEAASLANVNVKTDEGTPETADVAVPPAAAGNVKATPVGTSGSSTEVPTPVVATATCGTCGSALSEDLRFCTNCGTPVPMQVSVGVAAPPAPTVVASPLPPPVPQGSVSAAAACTTCGEQLTPDLRFCTNCGTPAPPAPDLTQAPPPAPSPLTTTGATCTQCGGSIKPGRHFCTQCGAPVETPEPAVPVTTVCPGCGEQLEEEDLFCCNCGTRRQVS